MVRITRLAAAGVEIADDINARSGFFANTQPGRSPGRTHLDNTIVGYLHLTIIAIVTDEKSTGAVVKISAIIEAPRPKGTLILSSIGFAINQIIMTQDDAVVHVQLLRYANLALHIESVRTDGHFTNTDPADGIKRKPGRTKCCPRPWAETSHAGGLTVAQPKIVLPDSA